MKKIMTYGALLLILLLVIGFYNVSQVKPSPSSVKAAGSSSKTSATPAQLNASQHIARIGQLSKDQYAGVDEYKLWSPSTCSTTSMTEVINAYYQALGINKQLRITDVLKVEVAQHAITPELGLLEPSGIERTVAQFGFEASILDSPTIRTLIQTANAGQPVIISFPPERWSGGHLLVVRGGTSDQVYLVDSSKLNMQVMDFPTFTKYWGGFAAVITPLQALLEKGGQA